MENSRNHKNVTILHSLSPKGYVHQQQLYPKHVESPADKYNQLKSFFFKNTPKRIMDNVVNNIQRDSLHSILSGSDVASGDDQVFTRNNSNSLRRRTISSNSLSSQCPSSSASSHNGYEGGDHDDTGASHEDGQGNGTIHEEFYEEDTDDRDIDPDDPYQINVLNEIPHEHLKELYTQVVDELLDIQLEFEEKLAEAEEQAHADLDKQKDELNKEKDEMKEGFENDLLKHKAAIGKLQERIAKNQEQLSEHATQAATSSKSSEEISKLEQYFKEKIDQLKEDYDEEKKNAIDVEAKFDKYKERMAKSEEEYKGSIKQMAQMEIENDELKSDARQMGYMVEDLEQKLDSQLELNELLKTEQDEMKLDLEEQVERLRQQLEDMQTELMVKEKELKKLKLNQLIIDTQASFSQANVKNNHSARHSNTVYKARNLLPGDSKSGVNGTPMNKSPDEDQAAAAGANPDGLSNAEVQERESKFLNALHESDQNEALKQRRDAQQRAGEDAADGKGAPGVDAKNNQGSPRSGENANTAEKASKQDPLNKSSDPAAGPKEASVESSPQVAAGRSGASPLVNSAARGAASRQGEQEPAAEAAEAAFVDPASQEKRRQLLPDGVPPEYGINFMGPDYMANADELLGTGVNGNSGLLDDLQIGNLDDILDCSGDDLMDIEQTAFMGSSKVMLNMIDTMLKTIDQRIEGVMIHNQPANHFEMNQMNQEAMKAQ